MVNPAKIEESPIILNVESLISTTELSIFLNVFGAEKGVIPSKIRTNPKHKIKIFIK